MRKIITSLCIFVMGLCLMTGCALFTPRERLWNIKGDITCKFHVSSNAKIDKPVEFTDITFDKDMFIKLYNEDRSYEPSYMNKHLDKCDLKIDPRTQTEEWKKIDNSEVMVQAEYEEGSSSVFVYKYNSKWYFFVLNKGGAAKEELQGSYYKELSKEMAEYWGPIFDQVLLNQ